MTNQLELTIDTVRDLMCFEQPNLTPEEAAFVLWNRFPEWSYESLLRSTLLVARVKEIVKKNTQ